MVAAENVWGSLAAQLAGDRGRVVSLVRSPATDPHSYEPVPADAEAIATARLVIVNGVGYDPWADRLLAAEPVSGRIVLNVGALVGVPTSGNPHRWYDPADVARVVDAVTHDLQALDPADAGYFAAQHDRLVRVGLAGYRAAIVAIAQRYAGTPVGASESVFAPLAAALHLRLLTPATFLRAVSEGTEPTAADKAIVDQQIRDHQILVYVYNSQNDTPDVRAQVAAARAAGIPVTAVTETLSPRTATFEQWQVAQLRALAAALAAATGR